MPGWDLPPQALVPPTCPLTTNTVAGKSRAARSGAATLWKFSNPSSNVRATASVAGGRSSKASRATTWTGPVASHSTCRLKAPASTEMGDPDGSIE